jgi:hypothetical protein
VVAGCGSSSPLSPPGLSSAQLRGYLLTLKELPPGWKMAPPSGSSRSTFCGLRNVFRSHETGRVQVDYARGDVSPSPGTRTNASLVVELLSEDLTSYDSPPTSEMAQAQAELDRCHGFTVDGHTAQLDPVVLPTFGDRSIAYQAREGAGPFMAVLDLIIAEKGHQAMAMVFGGIGAPTSQAVVFARQALAKLPG